MTEWGVVSIIAGVLGILGSIFGIADRISKPVKDLTANVVALTTEMKNLNQRLDKLDESNERAHVAILAREDRQEERIGEHEARLAILENR
jgi:hypothetical protein